MGKALNKRKKKIYSMISLILWVCLRVLRNSYFYDQHIESNGRFIIWFDVFFLFNRKRKLRKFSRVQYWIFEFLQTSSMNQKFFFMAFTILFYDLHFKSVKREWKTILPNRKRGTWRGTYNMNIRYIYVYFMFFIFYIRLNQYSCLCLFEWVWGRT